MELNKKKDNHTASSKKDEAKEKARFPTFGEIHLLGSLESGPSMAGRIPREPPAISRSIRERDPHEDTGALPDLDGLQGAMNAGPLARGGLAALKKLTKP